MIIKQTVKTTREFSAEECPGLKVAIEVEISDGKDCKDVTCMVETPGQGRNFLTMPKPIARVMAEMILEVIKP